jgi:hypothetical protein
MATLKMWSNQKSLTVAAGVVTLGLQLGAASAAQLADSIYDCTIGSEYLGEIKIERGTFAGLAFDLKFGESHPFEVAEGGAISLGAPLMGLGDKYKVVSTAVSEREGGRVGFDITIQANGSNSQTITCSPR